MKKKWMWIIGVIVVIVLIAIALILKQANSSSDKKDGYDTYKVEKESPLNLEGKASPKSVKTYNNNSQLGTYVSTQVDDGQSVKQGDPLINYEINNNKRQQLVDKVDNAKDENERAEAQQQLNQYDRQVKDSIYAAFDGKIDIKNRENVSDGEPVLQLVADEPQIKATVTEFDLGKIKEGDKVDVKVTSTGKKGKGEIKKISELPKSYEESLSKSGGGAAAGSGSEEDGGAQASNPVSDPSSESDSDSSKYTIVISDIDIPVRAGYSMEVEVPLDAIKLPKSVLTKDNNVFVLGKDNKVEKRDIKIDKVNGEIFVKEGLKKGDKLIKNPKKSMNDGDKVEVSS
ncbi:efflux RND transporter periplasmic adaptor subunit [Staphylococcus cohnii]|uniref:Periplasmic component of efflux system n=1 Tax=Staphylococcus cohnii subsp. cohnii TaxID=74704 RepID=A0A0M2NZ67_STACC|nr:HlyD family efflux transporter periplasmic adaptor subunit [Staphylococcus cohnii]TGP64785.1 HlyD family efflux transporter periplasmic adaptor subunit [bacterium M00.F.Ca.ET.229.01.1.1]TGS41280.1 HlyD family efflux transporter periplasmic adaptor subunit [bacterium M00.F.Ca.ET.180.01.1.1]KKI63824.1 periplasmic component of efflux system [Staphylococcus cohnii subsp. cohnii]OIS37312.1 RND transporter [Staphylococcus cohnii]OIS37526.1 RND transporter [Staphylococcus cohnii]